MSWAASPAEALWVLLTALFSLVLDDEPAVEAAPSSVPDTVLEPQPKKKKLEGSKVDKEQKLPQPALKKRRSLQAQRKPLKASQPSLKMMRPQVPTRKKHRVKQNGQ